MKFHHIFIFVLFHCLLFACSNEGEELIDESIKYNYSSSISQPEILKVDKDGVSLRYKIQGYDTNIIQECGVIWYLEENRDLWSNCIESYKDKTSNTIIQRIANGLPLDKTIYIRAYVISNNTISYGPFVSVVPNGASKPSIKSISPETPQLSQQIIIKGENFVKTKNPSIQSVLINNFEIIPDLVSENEIRFSLPKEYIESYNYSEEMNIGIKILGEKILYNKSIQLKSAWKKLEIPDIFPSTLYRGTAATLRNKGYVFLGFDSYIYEYDVINNQWKKTNGIEQGIFSKEGSYAFTKDDKLYFFNNPNLLVKKEDEKWQYLTHYKFYADLPKGDIGPFVFQYGNYLYRGNFDVNYMGRGRAFFRLDLTTNQWEKLTPIPNSGGGIYVHFIFPYNGDLNIGAIRNNEPWEFSKNIRIWSYSIEKDRWSWNFQPENEYESEFPVTDNVNEIVSFQLGDQIFVGLGRNHDWPEYCSDKLWKFNSDSKSWNIITRSPQKMNPVAVFTHNGKAYILGTSQDGHQKYFYEFNPELL